MDVFLGEECPRKAHASIDAKRDPGMASRKSLKSIYDVNEKCSFPRSDLDGMIVG